MIYRGWGILTLITPIAAILLLAYFFPRRPQGQHPALAGVAGCQHWRGGECAAGPVAQPGTRQKGEVAPHHFFFVPMQWAALAIVAVCVVVALLR